MPDLDNYTFLVTDLLTGDIIDSVILSSYSFSEIYQGPGASNATARIDLKSTNKVNFASWRNALWAIDPDGTIINGGLLAGIQNRGGSRVVQVPARGFFYYFRNRFLRSTQGMMYATLESGTNVQWKDVDQFHIFQDMINHAQSFTDGNINIGVVWDELSGVLKDKNHSINAVPKIGIELEELMGRLDGFDYRQTYRFDGDNPRCDFKLSFPKHKETLDEVLLFQPTKTIIQLTPISNALVLDGTAGGYASAGDITNVVGDIDISIHFIANDWTPATTQTIQSKDGGPGNFSWRVLLMPSGKIRFEWSDDGTRIWFKQSTQPTLFVDGESGTIRITLDVDDGAGGHNAAIYKSTDGGVTWILITDPLPDLFETNFSILH